MNSADSRGLAALAELMAAMPQKPTSKPKKKKMQTGLVMFPASKRQYFQTAQGKLLRVDGKRGAKDRAKGWI